MRMKTYRLHFIGVLILLVLTSGVLYVWHKSHSTTSFPVKCEAAITQVSTIDALLAGVYDGETSLAELKQYGDFGIGTFERLDGEMAVHDIQKYPVDSICLRAQKGGLA